ncbi:MAG TPA: hypothetical protein PKL08_02940, partial [Thermoanaerobaculaceae bacterium]|nr:hypothetical protein [Thermoanaerobaculaceae bacterium]
ADAGSSRGGGRLVLWLLVLGLGGMVAWLAADRNARRWAVEQDGGQVVVSRGRHFLFGMQRVSADNPVLGKAYGPIPVPAGTTVTTAELDDQVALDRAILDALLPAVRAARDGDAASRERAEVVLGRLSELPGLTPSQLAALGSIRGDFAYAGARADLREAAHLAHEGWRKLQLVQAGSGEHALEAAAMEAALRDIATTLGELADGRVPPPVSATRVPAEAR